MNKRDKARLEKASLRLKIMREVSVQADNFYAEAEILGKIAAQNAHKGDTRRRSQITNLENVANNAMKVADVLNYLKKQIGRDTKQEYWQKQKLGEQLITIITGKLKQDRERICQVLSLSDPAEGQRIHIYLIREFVRQLAAHYEFEVNR